MKVLLGKVFVMNVVVMVVIVYSFYVLFSLGE